MFRPEIAVHFAHQFVLLAALQEFLFGVDVSSQPRHEIVKQGRGETKIRITELAVGSRYLVPQSCHIGIRAHLARAGRHVEIEHFFRQALYIIAPYPARGSGIIEHPFLRQPVHLDEPLYRAPVAINM